MRRAMIFCAGGLLAWVLPVGADQVILTNGNTLSGSLIKLLDGQLDFKTDLAGEVTIKLSDVDTLSTDSPVVIELKDGTIVDRRIKSAESGKVSIDGGAVLQEQEFNISDITAINRPPKPKPRWRGGLSAGWTITSGNTRSDNRSASLNALKRTDKDRFTIGVDYGHGEQRDPQTKADIKTEDWWRLMAKYDYFFLPTVYGFVNGRYEKDDIALLDRRIILGGGAGYQWIDTERTDIGLEFGLASRYEKYKNDPDGNSTLSLQLGYHILHEFSDSVVLVHNLSYLPSTEHFSDYYLTTTAEIVANFSKHFFGTFKTIFNYAATPATGQGSTDVKYLLGIGLNF